MELAELIITVVVLVVGVAVAIVIASLGLVTGTKNPQPVPDRKPIGEVSPPPPPKSPTAMRPKTIEESCREKCDRAFLSSIGIDPDAKQPTGKVSWVNVIDVGIGGVTEREA